MINKISLNNVATYSNCTLDLADKKFIFIYGQNGSGKTILSNYLYHLNHYKEPVSAVEFSNSEIDSLDFSSCSVEPNQEHVDLLVFNQTFIDENFHQKDKQNGIFTLSKENKDALNKIKQYNLEYEKLISDFDENKLNFEQNIPQKKESEFKKLQDLLWVYKSDNLSDLDIPASWKTGSFGTKSNFCNKLLSFEVPDIEPERSIDSVLEEANKLKDLDDPILPIEKIEADFSAVENDSIFQKVIAGSNTSEFSKLNDDINKLSWFNKGVEYIDLESDKIQECPFCFNKTIDKDFVGNLKKYFDVSYENDLKKLNSLNAMYKKSLDDLTKQFILIENNDFYKEDYKKIEEIYTMAVQDVENNSSLIEDKINSPNLKITLKSSDSYISEINILIDSINNNIKDFNKQISDKDSAMAEHENAFWNRIVWSNRAAILEYKKEIELINQSLNEAKIKEKNLLDTISDIKNKIAIENSKTINVQEAIDNINNNLCSIGYTEFCIEKAEEENFYMLTRGDEKHNVFKTLSEGEKGVISFLYFLERCRGKASPKQAVEHKIVVIDDPISSMSHNNLFNISSFINNEFIRQEDKYEQVIILTHSLYFFHEVYNRLKNKINNKISRLEKEAAAEEEIEKYLNYGLYRIAKINNKSMVERIENDSNMIKNEYQAYWEIVKNDKTETLLLANAMRNIFEYFFGFVENINLNDYFNKCIDEDLANDAFYRFMNRESHSDVINIYDFKDFEREKLLALFKKVFVDNSYSKHYETMIK